jgi:hypothetical protein
MNDRIGGNDGPDTIDIPGECDGCRRLRYGLPSFGRHTGHKYGERPGRDRRKAMTMTFEDIAAQAAAFRAALTDALTEDEQLELLRAEFTDHWVITVDHGKWEALPWTNMRESLLVDATSAVALFDQILERKGR